MKKVIFSILILCSINATAQQSVNVDDFSLKFEEPEKNHIYLFAAGTLFTALGANGLLAKNENADQKFQNYSAIGFGLGMITGSVVFDIGQTSPKKKKDRTTMNPNPFRHRIPFLHTSSFDIQLFLIRVKSWCSPDSYQSPIQPKDAFPEAILHFPWTQSPSITQFSIHNLNKETEHYGLVVNALQSGNF